MDGTGPAVQQLTPTSITSTATVAFRVIDAGSGVDPDTVRITADGANVAAMPDATGRINVTPDGGTWDPGTHTFTVLAGDTLGNRAVFTGRVSVSKPSPPATPKPKPKPLLRGAYVRTMCGYTQRPRTLCLWASDSSFGLRWTHWGAGTATATGRISHHGYPTYRYWSRPAQVQLSRIRVCGRRRVYTHVRWRERGQRHWRTGRWYGSDCMVSG